MRNLVPQDLFVYGQQRQTFQMRLCYQETVEWITMNRRKTARSLCMFDSNR